MIAAREYKRVCERARRDFAHVLPEMLKYQPKRFWGMFSSGTRDDVSI